MIVGAYDPTKPDGGLVVGDRVPGYIRDALLNFMSAAACDIAGFMESGYRSLGLQALGNQLTVARKNAACYAGTPPPSSIQPGQPEFTGGQCAVDYFMEYSWEQEGLPGEFGTITRTIGQTPPIRGPIVRTEMNEFPAETQFVVVTGVAPNFGGRLLASGSNIRNGRMIRVQRVDGLPDDCGDPFTPPPSYPDGVELPPPPVAGDVIYEGDTYNVEVDIGGSLETVSVEVGDVVFSPELGVEFSVGDLNFVLSPSFTLEVGLPGGGVSDAETLRLLNEIKMNLEQDISGSIAGVDCSRNSIVNEYSGQGIKGLQAQAEAVFLTLSDVLFDQCPVEAELESNLSMRVLANGTVGVNDVTLVPIDDLARAVCLEVSGLPDGLRVYKPAGDEIEAPFGWMCVQSVDGSATWNGTNIDVKTRRVFYPIGRPRGFERRIRLSLKRGLDWTLYVMEVD